MKWLYRLFVLMFFVFVIAGFVLGYCACFANVSTSNNYCWAAILSFIGAVFCFVVGALLECGVWQ